MPRSYCRAQRIYPRADCQPNHRNQAQRTDALIPAHRCLTTGLTLAKPTATDWLAPRYTSVPAPT